MKQPLGKAGPGEVPKGDGSTQTLPITVGAVQWSTGGAGRADVAGEQGYFFYLLGWGWGRGDSGEEADPASPGSGQYLFGRESRKRSIVTQRILEPC